MFLYNYSDRTIHGIFKAVSEGSLEINPKGTFLQCTSWQFSAAALCSDALLMTPEMAICRMDHLSKPADTVPSSGAGRGVQPVPFPE